MALIQSVINFNDVDKVPHEEFLLHTHNTHKLQFNASHPKYKECFFEMDLSSMMGQREADENIVCCICVA